MSQDPQTPSLTEALLRRLRAATRDLRVCLPGRVTSYDATKARATVQPRVPDGFFDEAGQRQIVRLPPVADVPVVFPGAGDYQIDFPIAAGDTVLLVFSSSSLDRWLSTGNEVDPGDDGPRGLSDAIAIPGLRDFAHPYAGPASKRIKFTSTTVEVGGSQFLALQSEVKAIRDALHLHTHPHGDPTTGPGPSVPNPAGCLVTKGG